MSSENKITKQEKLIIKRRGFLFKGFFALAFMGISLRLWNLQIINGKKYKKLSENNRIRILPVQGLRGFIYDKNKLIVAKNNPSYDLVITPDKINLKESLKKISYTLGIPYLTLETNFRINKSKSNFEPIKIYSNLNWEQVVLVESYQEEFTGILINVSQVRFYSQNNNLVHILGYLNQIDRKNLKKVKTNQIKSAVLVGSSGIEQQYNDVLLGTDGQIRVEINSYGKVVNTQYIKPPTDGNKIYLNLDNRIQKYIYYVLKEKKGAAIIMEPKNGKVLAMCSNPTFDPNIFSSHLSKKEWKKFSTNKKSFLNNRCIQGLYSPGSTFKMVVAIAALEEGIIDKNFTYKCVGHYKLNRKLYNCWKRSGHGVVNLVDAIANSCNTFFYNLGLELGVEKIHKYATKMNLGKLTNIDIPNEKKGLIPNKEWKLKNKNSKWFLGETINVSIGQSYVSVTPIQLINYVNALINGGNLITPKVVDYIDKGGVKQKTKSESSPLNFDPQNIEIVLEGMRQSVSSKTGTNHSIANSLFTIGGKTGTTQVISNKTRRKIIEEKGKIDPSLEDHSWFVGFAPAVNPKLSVVVLLENGKSGKNAAIVAKKILQPYFQNKFGDFSSTT